MGKTYRLNSTGKKKITFSLPETIQHSEAVKAVLDIIKEMNQDRPITSVDIPQLHRMVTAYDCYLTCVDVVSEHGMTTQNIKGEWVKRPEANLMRENWAQYLEIAKEYGLTPRSRKATKGTTEDGKETEADAFFAGK